MTTFQRGIALLLVSFGCGGGDAGTSGGGGGGGNVGFGGAQDIGAFRAILDDGGIPGENTLDAGGFFAEHYSESPPADCGQRLCAVARMAVGRDWVSGRDQAFVQLSLTTPVDPATVERKPLNLVVVIDTSGSMAEDDRIGYVKTGLHRLIDELEDGDRLALVTYSNGVTEWSGLDQPLDRAALHAAADELVADGGTNLYGGLERGFQIANASLDLERQNRVMLMSDGLPTAGITDDGSIVSMAEGYVSDGVGLTTIGVGLDFNILLMRRLAERGAGSFYFLESPQAIAEVFSEELDYAMEPLALEVALDVQTDADWTIGEVIGTHDWIGSPTSGGLALPAVFVASRTDDQPGEYGRRGGGGALFLSVARATGESPWLTTGPVATIDLSYRLPGSSEVLHQEVAVRSEASAASDDPWLSAESMAEHYAMLSMYLGLREATRDADWSYSCARTALERLDERAARWALDTGDEDIAADRALIAQFIGNLEAHGGTAVAGDYSAACAADGTDEYGDYGDDTVQYQDGYYACAAAGPPGGWSIAAIALFLIYRRRRRP